MKHRLTLYLSLLFVIITAFSLLPTSPPPPGAVGPYLNGVFPTKTPGASGAWSLEDPWPGLSVPSPLRIVPFPGSEDVLVLSKQGEIWRVSFADQTQELVLDIKDRAFKAGEAGTTGIALHPEFGNPAAPDKQCVFVFYRHKPQPNSWDEKGFNRLSKFFWDEGAGQFDESTEEILFQQYDRSTWHNGGGMFFHPEDGFLYIALGDEGHQDYKAISNQRIDRGFFGGMLRIDVDNDPNRSHPIRRQPQPAEWGPQDPSWGETYAQGYSIPNDNPWQDEEGGILEEFCAIGMRSPFSVSYDEKSDKIWLGDVGEALREEISTVVKGQNLQWPYREGTVASEEFSRPDNLIGEEQPPVYEYGREVGGCIIGGAVYRGDRFPNLWGKYLFADYLEGKIMALNAEEENAASEHELLIADIENLGLDLPEDPGITGLFPQADGSILVTVQSTDFATPGKILRLTSEEVIPDPPTLLSELGVFTDLQTLAVAPGILPYTVNSPLWSDRAVKKRWMAIPNDGTFDEPEEQIVFDRMEDWQFPEGTVFIKHFELPVDESKGATVRLETRFFIMGEGGRSYGLTYRWNEAGTDAELLKSKASRAYTLYENGNPVGTQVWEFPGRDQCLSCHTPNANYVLGVKTHQLNGPMMYPGSALSVNQLSYLSQTGILDQPISNPGRLPRAYAIDDETADLELRVRSYLDANCASCHRLGGVAEVDLDFRFQLPLHLQNFINQPTSSSNSDPDRLIVKPGDHANSEIWVRDASLSGNQMPPLARSIIDEVYIDYLAEWIDQLPPDAGTINELILYPNPTQDLLGIRLSDAWVGPFQGQVLNLKGQKVRSFTFNSHAHSINVGDMEAGTYIFHMSSGSERVVKKFVVQ